MLDQLKQTAGELDIERFVTFTGRLPWEEAMKLLSTVDLCVDPSPSNPLNVNITTIKAMEYMALGKPFVAYDLAGTHESAQGAALYSACTAVRWPR